MAGVDLGHAQAHLEELVDKAAHGEEVILTKGGQPVAKLVPLPRAKARRQFGSAKGLITISEDFDAPLDDFAEYR